MILEEEYAEADGNSADWGIGTGVVWAVTAALAGMYAGTGNVGFGVAAAFGIALAIVCAVGYLRCRRTIKAWRDQKRFEIAQREVERMGGAG